MYSMNQVYFKALFCLSLAASLSGCTTAGTDVKSLMGSLSLFKLESNEKRIQNTSELSAITISAECTALTTGFEFDISNPATDSWSSVPAAFFTAVDQCSSSGTVVFSIDLSSQASFSTMVLGDTYQVRIRDINMIGIQTTEVLQITYSNFSLAANKRVAGHGGDTVLTSNSFALKGRLVEISDSDSTSGVYSLKGSLIFQ